VFFGEPFGGLIPGARGAVLSVLLRTDAPLTGRQVHGLVSDRHSMSLWSVQEALKALTGMGIVETQTIGRAGVHTINEGHAAVTHLRILADPIAMLRAAITESVGSGVESVIVFGSLARGEASQASDIDLAVIAGPEWEARTHLEDAVRTRVGNSCDVLVFTPSRFQQLASSGEPVVSDIIRDGFALLGSMPRATGGAA
jgi:predicted nucleotidyltransferase